MAPGARAQPCADPSQLQISYGAQAFTVVRRLTGVRAPLISSGRAEIAPDQVVWQVLDPLEIRTVITPSGVTQTVADGPTQQISTNGDIFFSSSGLYSLLTGDFQALRAFYSINRGSGAANGHWLMQLKPKDAKLAQFVSALEVTGCKSVSGVTLRQPAGDRMEITFAPLED